jgi:hypothetical protein
MFSIRKMCIFCKTHLQKTYFDTDYTISDDSPHTVILINGGVFNGDIDLNSSKNIKFILA